jgi:AraC-like DNA-binding protein
MSSLAAPVADGQYSPTRTDGVIPEERAWRALPRGLALGASEPSVVATRWLAFNERSQEFAAETPGDRHIVKIVLRSASLRLAVAGRAIVDGGVTPGLFHVTPPAVPARCLFRGSYDVLHLHIPNDLVAEYARDLLGEGIRALGAVSDPGNDPVVERLGRALLAADEFGGSLGQLYADCVGIAIVARLAARCGARPSGRSPPKGLPRWQLKRAIDFVESHLAEPLGLSAIAAATGLTRMHFATQFRVATGLRPHEYLLRRRIERAQEMLIGSEKSLVEIALNVGFQTQSHFTTVFKRLAGEPPGAWRQSRRDAACPVSPQLGDEARGRP